MQELKRKLTSRKLWAAAAGFAAALAVAFGVDELTAEQIAAVISAVGLLIAYILGESYVDANRTAKDTDAEKKE